MQDTQIKIMNFHEKMDKNINEVEEQLLTLESIQLANAQKSKRRY